MGVIGSEKLMFKFGDVAKYITVEEAFNICESSKAIPEVVINGQWSKCKIKKHEPEKLLKIGYSVKYANGDVVDDEIIVPVGAKIQTSAGLIQAEKLKKHSIFTSPLKCNLPDVKCPKNGTSEDYNTHKYADGRAIAPIIRSGVELNHPVSGLHYKMLMNTDAVDGFIKKQSYGSFSPTPKMFEERIDVEESPYSGKSFVTLWLPEAAEVVNTYKISTGLDYGDFDESIVLEGHNFCLGFINGWILDGWNSETDGSFVIDNNKRIISKLSCIASMVGYSIIRDPQNDGAFKITKRHPEATITHLKRSVEKREYFTIKVKNPLYPYYVIKGGILLCDHEIEK